MEKNIEVSLLLDFYGELLKPGVRQTIDLYYNDDLSLSEVAAQCGITRQGVRDVIVRAENAMQEIEDKTGIIKRFQSQRPLLDKITASAVKIKELNALQYFDPQISELADRIADDAGTLKE